MMVSADKDPDLFKAAAISLGMLGVVTEVTLRYEESFLLEETTTNHPLDFCIEHFDELARSAQHVKFWLELNSNLCCTYQTNRTTKDPHNNPSLMKRSIEVGIEPHAATHTPAG